MTEKEQFIALCRQYIKREGIEELLANLEKGDFYTAPASTRYHDSCEGGLLHHSLKVFNNMEEKNETTAIVALFHDLCKMNYYVVEMRNKKDEHGKWIQVPYYTVDDAFPYGHSEKSVYLLNEVSKLTNEEAMAIRWHMGGFEAKENYQYLSKAYSMYPLAVKLSIADLQATYLD